MEYQDGILYYRSPEEKLCPEGMARSVTCNTKSRSVMVPEYSQGIGFQDLYGYQNPQFSALLYKVA